jgi:hypothetical protein
MNKYEWLEAVMASNLSNATKVFAYGIFKHMNGEGTCFPGEDALMAVVGISRGHFSEYRRVLSEGGWLNMDERKTKNGKSYTYSIPQTAPSGEQTAPSGEQTAPSGEQTAPSGEQTAPSGCANTVSNTSRNTPSNSVINTAPTAGANAPVRLFASKGGSDASLLNGDTAGPLTQTGDAARAHPEGAVYEDAW